MHIKLFRFCLPCQLLNSAVCVDILHRRPVKCTTLTKCVRTGCENFLPLLAFRVLSFPVILPRMGFIKAYKHIWSPHRLCVGSSPLRESICQLQTTVTFGGRAPCGFLQPFDPSCIWPESSGLAELEAGSALKEGTKKKKKKERTVRVKLSRFNRAEVWDWPADGLTRSIRLLFVV